MNGIEQIRESRKDGYWGSPQDGYECLEAERHVDYLLAEVDRLHKKLAALERQQAVVEAARALRSLNDMESSTVVTVSKVRFAALLAALAALEAGGG